MTAAIYRTIGGQLIHLIDALEQGYCQTCICGRDDDDHKDADHPFERQIPEATPCPGCGGECDPDRHYGVYVTRVAYVTYCSPECAWKHDPKKWEQYK